MTGDISILPESIPLYGAPTAMDHFTYIQGRLHAEEVPIAHIAPGRMR